MTTLRCSNCGRFTTPDQSVNIEGIVTCKRCLKPVKDDIVTHLDKKDQQPEQKPTQAPKHDGPLILLYVVAAAAVAFVAYQALVIWWL